MPTEMINDRRYTMPIYQKAEAARIVDLPESTFRKWALGYSCKTIGGAQRASEPIITTAPGPGRLPTVPFVGLAEAYIVSAFKKTGVPMKRIRPAIEWLQKNIGLDQALASERLRTDGANVLWDFSRQSENPADSDMIGSLVVVQSGQGVFQGVVKDYLQRISYQDGWVRTIDLPQYNDDDITIIVDPWINGGQPTVAERGIAVIDIVSRLQAGEAPTEVAYDYELPIASLRALARAA